MSSAARYQHLNTLPLWEQMEPISLEQMHAVKLMNRIDTKYVVSEEEALKLLEKMAECGYRVQVIDGVRACRYDTLYYDTALRDMYVAHHNRQLTRQKVRTRTYVETGLTFLEIKNKSNRGRTKKRRTEIARDNFYSFAESAEASSFYKEHGRYPHAAISPALATRFVRITLGFKTHDGTHFLVFCTIHHCEWHTDIPLAHCIDLSRNLWRKILVLELTSSCIRIRHQTTTHNCRLVLRITSNSMLKRQAIR